MYRTVFWTLWEKARVGCFKRTASKHVYYPGWNRSPAQVGCMRQALGPGALGRPRGIGWRGRWEGGIRMGNTCKSMADSFQCMTKPTTIKKIKKFLKKRILAVCWIIVLHPVCLRQLFFPTLCLSSHSLDSVFAEQMILIVMKSSLSIISYMYSSFVFNIHHHIYYHLGFLLWYLPVLQIYI